VARFVCLQQLLDTLQTSIMLPRLTQPLRARGRAHMKICWTLCLPRLILTSVMAMATKPNKKSPVLPFDALRDLLSSNLPSAEIVLNHITKGHKFDADLLQQTLDGWFPIFRVIATISLPVAGIYSAMWCTPTNLLMDLLFFQP